MIKEFKQGVAKAEIECQADPVVSIKLTAPISALKKLNSILSESDGTNEGAPYDAWFVFDDAVKAVKP